MNSNQEETKVMATKQEEDFKCKVTAFAKRVDGTREGATFYIIDDHLFRTTSIRFNLLKVYCLGFYTKWSKGLPRCKRRAVLDQETLRITKVVGEHSCDQDPEFATRLCMETEMKQLAAMTTDNFRDIFDKVGRKNPIIADRIPFDRICAAMKTRRFRAKPYQF